MERSRVVAAPAGPTFEVVLADPLPEVFDRRYLLIPPIRAEVRLAGEGPWGSAVGQRRRVLLADGGTMVETLETLTDVRATYTMTEVTGVFGLLITAVDGSWEVAQVPGGTRVTWRWELRLRNVLGRLALPVLVRCWHGYADLALARISERVARR